MLPIYCYLVMGSLIAASAAMSTSALDGITRDAEKSADNALATAGARLKQASINNALPNTIDGLVGAGEVAHPWLRYAVARGVSDGTWRFDRAILYVAKPGTAAEATDLLTATNACGAGAFGSAASYCLAVSIPSVRVQGNDAATTVVSATKNALNRTMRKMLSSYYRSGLFPATSPTTGALTPGQSVSVASFVGYTGTAAGCTGIHYFVDVPMDCTDLFEGQSGNPVLYHYVNNNQAGLFVQSRLQRSNGEFVVIGTEAIGT